MTISIDDRLTYWWWANYCEEKMMPCPFCGGQGKFDVDHILGSLVYVVYCINCGIRKQFGETSWRDDRGKDYKEYSNQQLYRGLSGKALGFWNKRATK